ncbi:MAG: hypothetical protein Q9166_007441 [cf. Caloplaca sp. 2 TL-2023]
MSSLYFVNVNWGPTYCSPCRRSFATNDAYQTHLVNSKSHNWCKLCNREFGTPSGRLAHWSNSDIHEFTYCWICEWDYQDSENLQAHSRTYHIYCDKCERAFETENDRLKHWENSTHHGNSYCADCKWDYKNADGFHEHVRSQHISHYCSSCNRTFVSEASRLAHFESNPLHKDSFCSDCKDDFGSSNGLKQHWRSHEKHVGTYDFICDLKFPNKKTRTEHLNANPAKHFVCVQHQQFCGTQKALETHWKQSQDHAKCTPCNLGFQTEQDRNQHFMTSDRHPKCTKCEIGLEDHTQQQAHYLNSAVHAKCSQCKQGFIDSADLNTHYWRSLLHTSKCYKCHLGFSSLQGLTDHFKTSPEHFYDDSCRVAFDSSEQLKEHYSKDRRHNYCKRCDGLYDSRSLLVAHWTNSKEHKSTYCARCDIHFVSHNMLLMHKVLSVKHHLCVRCAQDYATNEKYMQHLQTSSAHSFTFCKVCNRDFADKAELMDHAEIHKPKPILCFAGCKNTMSFESVSGVLMHLESGTCSKGWTKQHINAMIAENPKAFSVLIPPRSAFFLAGAPRLQAIDSDFNGSVWKCQLCKASQLSLLDLERHLQSQQCHGQYPFVLRCTDCQASFTTVSQLMRHVEKGHCQAAAAVVDRVVESMKEKMSADGGNAGRLEVLHQLRIDTTKGKDLIVKVSMNSTPITNQ